ncbi:transgelin-2-like isoform X2 [Antedon mediterranea]|uniref:transgelin-2-like isoform X2 n=2 Tax=Antedon mediterranea TaxID=105859 RepID=UPI003AF9145E
MADRPKGFGFSAEVAAKMDSKYSVENASKAAKWIDALLKDTTIASSPEAGELHEKLKDGTVLCRVINTLKPGSVKKVNTSKMAFKMMENIGNFLVGCTKYGISTTDLFQTVDLYENQNMSQVVQTILALANASKEQVDTGVDAGVKVSAGNKREFTDEQLKEGQNVIGLQMGTNKMASQSGMTGYGTGRQIIN